MAFSSSSQKGQIPVGCQLCEGGSKIQWKCCDCDVLMCTKCKEKIHSKFKNGSNHKIIDIKEVGQHMDESSSINCQKHADQPCFLFCKTCKEPVCPKCIIQTHNGHNFVDEEEYRLKKEKIRHKKAIETNLNHLTKVKKELGKIKKSEFVRYEKSKKDILAQKKILDKQVEELMNELDDQWKKANKDFEKNQNEFDNMEKKLLKENTTINQIIKSKDFLHFFNELDKLESILDGDDDNNVLINPKYSIMPEFLSGEVTRDNIGTFETEDTPEVHVTKL